MAKSDVFYFYFYFFYLHPLIRIPKVQGTVDRVNSAFDKHVLVRFCGAFIDGRVIS